MNKYFSSVGENDQMVVRIGLNLMLIRNLNNNSKCLVVKSVS